ncbi:hypothetical protein [Citrobacter sp. FDAARGOS_156]|nr:hypothetical protein [Citrobacter youngae]
MSTEAAIKIFDPRIAKLEPRGGKSSIHWDDRWAIEVAIFSTGISQ